MAALARPRVLRSTPPESLEPRRSEGIAAVKGVRDVNVNDSSRRLLLPEVREDSLDKRRNVGDRWDYTDGMEGGGKYHDMCAADVSHRGGRRACKAAGMAQRKGGKCLLSRHGTLIRYFLRSKGWKREVGDRRTLRDR